MPTNNENLFTYGRTISVNKIKFLPPVTRRTLISWSKLEPLPYNEDLVPGLQAPIADPLWMLARQWQFGEFQGEDAGTPVWSKLEGEIGHLRSYRPGATEPNAEAAPEYFHQALPLEAFVEKEEIRRGHPRLASEAGEHFIRLLAQNGIRNARPALRSAFPLDIPDDQIWSPVADTSGTAWQALFADRAVDGYKIARSLLENVDEEKRLVNLPDAFDELRVLGEENVLTAANEWIEWYTTHVMEPDTDQPKTAWINERQEYAFSLAAYFQNREVTLEAQEYTDGQLDWYSFRVKGNQAHASPDDAGMFEHYTQLPVLPTPVRYPGMPADRYWEFEDARVHLGRLDAGPTDLTRMLLAEFGLVYSNDWFLIPVDMPIGALFKPGSLLVRDTFGETTTVAPARNFDGAKWTMFSLSGSETLPASFRDVYFLPPTLPKKLEGEPLEEVALFRDEMANMSWAVERIVQGASGLPFNRNQEGRLGSLHQRINVHEVPANLIYRLMTPVADNWLPFVPVPADNSTNLFKFSIGLERRTLLKTQEDGSQIELHPRGVLVRSDLSTPVEDEPPLRLFEEEVPRGGIYVRRNFQFSRWIDGKRLLWVGRSKRAGRGEGASGLGFDVARFTQEKKITSDSDSE